MSVNIGDIVRVDYCDFDDLRKAKLEGTKPELSTGLFLVYSIDSHQLKSFGGLKVCSRATSFEVPLLKNKFPFLDHDSYINCICQFKFHEDLVVHRLGMVDTTVLAKVRKQLQNIGIDIDDKLEAEIKRQNIIAKINTR